MSQTLQFEVLTDLSAVGLQKIDTNFDAVKDALTAQLQPYTTLAVTEDGIADAKKDLAKLRKLRDGINAQKIAVKTEWLRPYTVFEAQAKELMGIVESGIGNIDGQIKAYDEERRAEKQKQIREIFSEATAKHGVGAYLTWDSVWNPKWLNIGYAMDAISEEIETAAAGTEEDLDFLRGLHSEFEAAVLDEYSRSRDVKAAMNAAARLKAIQEAESEANGAGGAETPKEDKSQMRGISADSGGISEPPVIPQPQFIRMDGEAPTEKRYTIRFEMTMTAREARALKDFLDGQGIHYRKI